MKNILILFQEDNRVWSMRRVLAFVFALAGIVLGACGLPWQIVAIFIGAALLLLFFTTWADVANVVKAVKDAK